MAIDADVHNYVRNNMQTPKDAFDLRRHQPMRIAKLGVIATAKYGVVESVTLFDSQQQIPLKTIFSQAFDFFWQMTQGLSPARTQYRTIKANAQWQSLHGAATRPINYVLNGTLVAQQVNDSIPCCNCGVIMTLDATTVDHRHPRAGGQLDAARRVFRAIALTQAEARNEAGRLISSQSPFDAERDGELGCTLTYNGMIFFTCLHLSNKYQEFSQMCLNHLVNLQPMCFRCNSQKGAWGY